MFSSPASVWAPFIRTAPLARVFCHVACCGVLCMVLCAAVTGCSQEKKTIESIRQAYEGGDFAEAVVLCERAFREDIDGSVVYYYYGLSLISLDRDIESFGALERAAGLDGALAPEIAAELVAAGKTSFDRGERSRAALRMKTAAVIDPAVELGRFGFLIAEACFEEREFDRAGRFFSAALEEFPDTVVAEGSFFKLAECLSETGDSLGAIDVLERQLQSFPVGTLAERAQWRLVSLLFESAQAEFDRGDYDSAAGILTRVIARSDNPSLVQKSRFMVGECYERTQDFEKAYVQYRTIIDEDMGASSRLVDRARSKIKTMDDAGLLDDLPNEMRQYLEK